MIIGCYDMHLYCAAKCAAERRRQTSKHAGGAGPAVGQFTHPHNEQGARREARRWGWVFAKDEAWCSTDCLKRGTAPEQEPKERPLTYCAGGSDGECYHPGCPQLRDGEPEKSGRHCPLDTRGDDDGC